MLSFKSFGIVTNKVLLVAFLLCNISFSMNQKDSLRVFVQNLSSNCIDSITASAFTNLLSSKITNLSNWELITITDINALVDLEMDKELFDCSSDDCMIKIASILGAPYLLSSEFHLVSNNIHIINISVIKVDEASVTQRKSFTINSVEDAFNQLDNIAYKIVGAQKKFKELAKEKALSGNTTGECKIPNIYSLDFDIAREKLLEEGWIPNHMSWQNASNLWGQAKKLWDLGYSEIQDCSGTGVSHCWFTYSDPAGRTLKVITGGEMINDSPKDISIWKYYIEEDKKN